MTTLIEAFASFRTSAWRLEARDDYNVPEYGAELSAFLSGRPRPPRSDGWQEVVQAAVGRGAHIGRVRVVGRPLTDYTRFEFALYAQNVTWGEDVRIVDRAWLDASWSAAPDVWLFDDQLAFRQDYTADGSYVGTAEVEADMIREIRRILVAASVPMSEYRLKEQPAPRPDTAPVGPLPYTDAG